MKVDIYKIVSIRHSICGYQNQLQWQGQQNLGKYIYLHQVTNILVYSHYLINKYCILHNADRMAYLLTHCDNGLMASGIVTLWVLLVCPDGALSPNKIG